MKPETDLCIFTVIRNLRDALESAHEGTSAWAHEVTSGSALQSPEGLRPGACVSGRASPSYARNRGNGERGYLASLPRRVGDLSTRLTPLNALLVRTRRCSEGPSLLAPLEDPPWGAWGHSGKCRVCLWRRWKWSLPPKGSIRYRGARGLLGGRGGSSSRRRLHLNPRALPGAAEPPCSPGVSLQGSLRRLRVQVFLFRWKCHRL